MASLKSSSVVSAESFKTIVTADQTGFVECLEVFGDDLTVVNAARVSFDKSSAVFTEADKKLVNYLAKHDHVSPFFHPQVRFRIKMPIFVAREWYRHTIGFARNEVSRRYVDTPPECWIPFPNELRERDPRIKQGSKTTPVDDADQVHLLLSNQMNLAMKVYQQLLDRNVAPEVARAVLPQSMYTEFIETGSLAAYARLCQLRLGSDAQKEIRDYAQAVSDALAKAFPASWAALQGCT
jgi:thymidylate synthase (FAD)